MIKQKSEKQDIVEIDGSEGEAGGQIVRTAVGLSALTGKPCRIYNIRAGRPKPGLMAQHLTCVQAVAELCGANVSGAELWSKELAFEPRKVKSGRFAFDVGTAGAVSLVLQSLMMPALAAPGRLKFEITGGTDVSWSPSTMYFEHVFCYWLGKMGIVVQATTERHGFYPKGGGRAIVEIEPSLPAPLFVIERGNLEKIEGISISSEALKKQKVAERQIEGAKSELPTISAKHHYVDTLSPGSAMHVHARFSNCMLGAGAIGERGKRAEEVGKEAAGLLKRQLGSDACADRWAADQLLPFLALAAENGPSKISVAEITGHCLTNVQVIEKFLPVKFEIGGERGKPGIIKCKKETKRS